MARRAPVTALLAVALIASTLAAAGPSPAPVRGASAAPAGNGSPGAARPPVAGPPRVVTRLGAGARSGPPAPASALIVRFRAGTSTAARAASLARAGVVPVRPLRSIRADVVRPGPGRSVAAAVAALASDPAVVYAEPDAPVVPAADPAAEPYLGSYQWALDNDGSSCAGETPCRAGVDIDAVEAWPLATGAGVTVAVLDDGVDLANPELAGQAWVNPGETGVDATGADKASNGIDDDGDGYVDDVNGVNLCDDVSSQTLHVDGTDWHGSAVASVLAAAADGSGMVGAAPDARIMVVRWLEPACSTVSYAVQAIDYAVEHGAHVINASWGTYQPSEALLDAVRRAAAAGVLIVAAAGNESSTIVLYPAAFDEPNVVSVGAIDAGGGLAGFSSRGQTVDVAAPGTSILAIDVLDGGYVLANGTSFAAPLVAAVAALVGQAQPDLLADPAALRDRLVDTGWPDPSIARPVTASGRVVDARNALDLSPPAAPAWLTGAARPGSRLGRTRVPVVLSWPAATDDLGIDAYRIRYRRTGSTAWSAPTAWSTRRSVGVRLAIGVSYDVELTTRDVGANTTSIVVPFRAVIRQEGLATYHGRWARTAWSSASAGHTAYATRAGSRARIVIHGRSVALVMPRARANGRVRVYVDGRYVRTLHLHASTTRPRRIVFRRSWSVSGTHTLRLVVVGTARHARVDLDAIVIGK